MLRFNKSFITFRFKVIKISRVFSLLFFSEQNMKTVFAVATFGSTSAIILSLIAVVLIFHDINNLYINVMMEMEEFRVSYQDHMEEKATNNNPGGFDSVPNLNKTCIFRQQQRIHGVKLHM